MPTGSKTGSLQTLVNAGGITGNNSLSVVGSSNPTFGVAAPAGLIGTINSQSGGTLTIQDASLQITGGNYNTFTIALFWTTSGDTILNCAYNITMSACTPSGGVDAITCTGGTSNPTGAKYYASSGAAPTTLPANGTPITLALNQDITDGVSIPGGTGQYIQQLIATSTQPGLVDWLKASGSTEERLSAILSSGAFDTWPTSSSQIGSLPTGSASANNWTASDTVTVIRCYNLGSTFANVGVSSATATMQAGVILA